MLAGTESPGRLYRFDADDRPFVLLDSGMAELRAISVDAGGVIFAAAVAKGDESASAGETPSVAVALAPPATTRRGARPPSTPRQAFGALPHRRQRHMGRALDVAAT